jgi:hypothetical protein
MPLCTLLLSIYNHPVLSQQPYTAFATAAVSLNKPTIEETVASDRFWNSQPEISGSFKSNLIY